MRRGEIRWYEFTRPDKKRPVLILSRDSSIKFLAEIIVCPITSTIREIPTEVFISRNDGMPKDCVANLDRLVTVPKNKLGKIITTLDHRKMLQIKTALLFALGF